MIAFIKWVMITICSILPDSPFADMIDSLYFNQSFLEYLNWFLPVDIVGNMFVSWVACILIFIMFRIIWKLIIDILMKKFLGTISTVAGLLG